MLTYNLLIVYQIPFVYSKNIIHELYFTTFTADKQGKNWKARNNTRTGNKGKENLDRGNPTVTHGIS